MATDLSQYDIQTIRKLIFTKCKDKKSLDKWIQLFLDIEFPDVIVDQNSNCTPLQMIWEVYSECMNAVVNLEEVNEDSRRYLYYSCRSGYKTLSESVIEVVAALHLDRSTAHMAAIKDQSQNAQRYVKGFFNRPYLRDFVESDNKNETWIVRYEDKRTGEILNKEEFEALDTASRNKYVEIKSFIKIIVATMTGANSLHTNLMCVDGDTNILSRILSPDKSGRARTKRTARGIFRSLKGRESGGRLGGETDLAISIKDGTIKKDVELLTLNHDTGNWEFVKITNANRALKETVKVTTEFGLELICTVEHPLLVPGKGYVNVSELNPGDRILRVGKSKSESNKKYKTVEFNAFREIGGLAHEDPWEQVLLGSLLGDCGIYKKPTNNPYIAENHGLAQADYLKWKKSIFSLKLNMRDTFPVSGYTGEDLVGISSGNTPLLLPYKDIRTSLEGPIDRLGALGLAVWYMDDGVKCNGFGISSEGFSKEQNLKLIELLDRNFGIKARLNEDKGVENGVPYHYYNIRGDLEAKRRLVDICKPYIHKDMAYKFDISGNKFNCNICNREVWHYERGNGISKDCGQIACRLVTQKTLHLDTIKSIEPAGKRFVYDFTLAKNHNYISNRLISHNCLDELDVIANKAAYDEAQAIPSASGGKLPITVLTSTRKFAFGLVQNEIDNSDKTGLKIRHWNIIDLATACPPKRHLPEAPKITIYRSSSLMQAISEEEYLKLPENEQEKFEKDVGYQGCLSNCKIFSSCKGRLATEQTSKSPLLIPLSQVLSQFKTMSVPFARAQLLCEKPSTEGLIYPSLDRDIHVIPAYKMAELITGNQFPAKFSKENLIDLFRKVGAKFVAGMDFGFTHAFSTVLGAVYGHRLYVFDTIYQFNLEPNEVIEACKKLKEFRPAIYADPENPAQIKMLKKDGHRMMTWDKNNGSVLAGIEVLRYKIKPSVGDPEIYFLQGDSGIDTLFRHMAQYHWLLDAAGKQTNEPDEEMDDLPDAIRYLVLNVFGRGGKVGVADTKVAVKATPGVYTKETWFQQVIQEHLSQDPNDGGMQTTNPDKKGGIKWSF